MKTFSAAIVALILGTGMNHAEPLALESKIPAVSAVDENGEAVDLSAHGEGFLFVYFYPKADTPGCTKQACSLRDAYEKVTGAGVKVFGVSNDTPAAQKAFKEKFELPFTLIADPEGKVIDAFGVPKRGPGMASRQAYLFKDGKLVWKDESASTEEQAADVLKAVEENK